MESKEIATRPESSAPVLLTGALSVAEMARQKELIQEHMKSTLKVDHHFGVVPGCGDKPTLLKPGAETICFIFNLAPLFTIEEIPVQHPTVTGHVKYRVKCKLSHRGTGVVISEGDGVCSTMESKYRYRSTERKCPHCQKETIFKSKHKAEWYCWAKKGGCGATFQVGDPAIEEQNTERREYENPADYYNTCTKMAAKRAIVAATLFGTAASDVFAQDLEDLRDVIEAQFERVPDDGGEQPAAQPARQRPAQAQRRAAAADTQERPKTWEEMTPEEQDAARRRAGAQAQPAPAKEYKMRPRGAAPAAQPATARPAADTRAAANGPVNPLRNPYMHRLEAQGFDQTGKELADIPIAMIRRALRDPGCRRRLTPADLANMELIDRTEAAGPAARDAGGAVAAPADLGRAEPDYSDRVGDEGDPDGHYPG